MAKVKATGSPSDLPGMRPALTPEGRENQMIALAENLAEKQLREGTASSQVIAHYLKLGSTRARAELEMIQINKELAIAKTEQIRSQKRQEELFAEAIRAMRKYSGNGREEDDGEY